MFSWFNKKKLTPKEEATLKQEPWIDAVTLHVDSTSLTRGYLELDWNEYFVKMLVNNGYGLESEPDYIIVNRWYRALIQAIAESEGITTVVAGNLPGEHEK